MKAARLFTPLIIVLVSIAWTAPNVQAQDAVQATDDLYEDRVVVTWQPAAEEAVEYRVLRDGVLLSLVSSEDTSYVDLTGNPQQAYTYCIEAGYVNGDVASLGCDAGRRLIFPPTEVRATDRTQEAFVRITWQNNSDVEAGYRIFRDGSPIADAPANSVLYEDETAAIDQTYSYCVAAFDADGFVSEQACDDGMRGAVLPPAAVSASDGQFEDRVFLSWTDQTEIDSGYIVWRDGVVLDTTEINAVAYNDLTAVTGQTYTYCVQTLALGGGVSVQACDDGIRGVLPKPGNLIASQGLYDDRIELTWSDPGDAEEGYIVLRAEEDAGVPAWELMDSTEANATSFVDVSAEGEVVYRYSIQAFAENGGLSDTANVTGWRRHVLAVTGLSASDEEFEDHVHLRWLNPGTQVALFRIYRDGTRIETLPAEQLSYDDFDIASGVAYTYCVEAVSALGHAAYPDVCDDGSRLLKAPTDLAADDGAAEDIVQLSWTDASLAEEGFYIYRKPVDSPDAAPLYDNTAADVTAYVDSFAAPGVTYAYSVVAFDSLGESTPAVDDGHRLFQAPANFAAADGAAEDRITLTWTDKSRVEVGYYVFRTAPGTPADIHNDVPFDTLAENTATYVDTDGITPGAAYTYTVAPFDSLGVSSAVSDEGYTVILPATSVKASDVYADRVVITWVDQSGVETAYEITRDGSFIASAASGATSYTDESAVAGVVYEYCVTTVAGSDASQRACDEGRVRSDQEEPIVVDAGNVQIPTDERITPLDLHTQEYFGRSVDMDGDFAVVGAPVSPWVNGMPYVNSRAVVFKRKNDGSWKEMSVLLDDETLTRAGFGVAISNEYIMVGQAILIPTNPDLFSGDVDSEIEIFKRTGGAWNSIQRFTLDTGDRTEVEDFRRVRVPVAMWGDYALAGVPHSDTWDASSGRINFYHLNANGQWERQGHTFNGFAQPNFGDQLGYSVDVHRDYAIVGAPGKNNHIGWVYIFKWDGAEWKVVEVLEGLDADDRFGDAVAISDKYAIVGAPYDEGGGNIYIYERDGDQWNVIQALHAGEVAGGEFGTSVDVWKDYVIAGDPRHSLEAAAYIFQLDGDHFTQKAKLFSQGAGGFGVSVDLDDGYAFMGAHTDDLSTDLVDAGSAYVRELTAKPRSVQASDGTTDGGVEISWEDRSTSEDGFYVYRDGVEIANVGADVVTFTDDEALPGSVSMYCVSSHNEVFGESERVCDYGWRPPNGALTGNVATRSGGAVEGVSVCLAPSPGQALQFDGTTASSALVDGVTMPTGDKTISFWVRTKDAGAGLISYADDGHSDPGNGANALLILNPENLELFVGATSTGPTGVSVADGQWHHVAVLVSERDGSKNVAVYKDGVVEYIMWPVSPALTLNGTGTLVIGQDQDVPGGGFQEAQAFEGLIDDIRIWNYTRSEEQIKTSMHEPISGDEDGLIHYWPIVSGSGRALIDFADDDGRHYASLHGGVYRSAVAAPLQTCAETDLEGNYAISGIRYGSKTTFNVTPSLGERQFEPAFKKITLSTDNPVQNEVAFRDITSFTIAGAVQYEGTQCYAENVQIMLDGSVAGATDAQGVYAISGLAGNRVVAPSLDGHTFTPAEQSFFLSEDVSEIDFTDNTQRTLNLQVGGGCGLNIGDVTLKIVSTNQCLTKEVTLDEAASLQLPPMVYNIMVSKVEVADGMSAALAIDIEEYFDNLGAQTVDLTKGDTLIKVLYRAPLKVTITGIEAKQCVGNLTLEGAPLPDVPIFAQGPTPIPLQVNVVEDYGFDVCPVDSGTVKIFDEIADVEDEATTLTVKDGKATYVTYANTPNLTGREVDGKNRSFQKAITAVATVGARSSQATRWALVTGHRPRPGADFVSIPLQLPQLILRDPPGNQSYSYRASGTKTCNTISDIFMEVAGLSNTIKVKAGMKFEAGTPFFATESESYAAASGGFELEFEANQNDGFTACMTAQEQFGTSSGPTFVGRPADVFLGIADNLAFTITDVVELNGCAVDVSQSIAIGGRDDADMTHYAFTRQHLKKVLIPQLEEFAANPALAGQEDAANYAQAAQTWQDHLDLGDALYTDALSGGDCETINCENRSFSAGADYQYSFVSDSTDAFTWTTKTSVSYENAVELGLDVGGSGVTARLGIRFGFNYTRSEGEENTTTRTTGYVLSDDNLGDYVSVDVREDPMFGTPVFDVVAGATSCPWEPWYPPSDPSEARTMPRDGAEIQANGTPVVKGADPDGEATFLISLTNQSATDETREYQLRVVQTSNPYGASIVGNGAFLASPSSYFITPGPDGTQQVTVSVSRGPIRYAYEGLKLMMYPPCEYALWENGAPLQRADTLALNAFFTAPCSDIAIVRPRENWKVNVFSDSIQVFLDDFVMEGVDGNALDQLGLEYREVGTELWLAGLFQTRGGLLDPDGDGNKLNPDEVIAYGEKWNFPAPDGQYELRAYTVCPTSGKVFSAIVPGVVDRKQPEVFGTPEPADGILAFGNDIAVEFDEPIDCQSVIDQGNHPTATLLHGGKPIATNVNCDGKTLTFAPETGFDAYEDDLLTAVVYSAIAVDDTTSLIGVTDLVGNPLKTAHPENFALTGNLSETDSLAWSFRLRREGFLWADQQAALAVPFGAPGSFDVQLMNGSPIDVSYALESALAGTDWSSHWLKPDAASGAVPAGSNAAIHFTIVDTLQKGVYRDTVIAVTATGTDSLFLSATVDCSAPFGLPAAGFAYSMNLVAQLDIPAPLGAGLSTDTTDVIAAFVGGELRGVAQVQEIAGQGIAFLTVSSDVTSGETVTFEIWDASSCTRYRAVQTQSFFSNAVYGEIADPLTITATQAERRALDLPSGWTWISTNMTHYATGDPLSVSEALSTIVPTPGDVLKSQTAYAQYSASSGWVGPLATVEPGKAYLLSVTEPSRLLLLGEPVTASAQPVALTSGWNWLGYLPQEAIPLNEALQDLSPTPQDGDIIKSQTAFAQYVQAADEWIGSLELMEPGRGYFIRLHEDGAGGDVDYTLTYPDEAIAAAVASAPAADTSSAPAAGPVLLASTKKGLRDVVRKERMLLGSTKRTVRVLHKEKVVGDEAERGPKWQASPGMYPQAMPLVAQLKVDGELLETKEARLAIYVGEELRGVGRPFYVKELDTYLVFAMIYGSPRIGAAEGDASSSGRLASWPATMHGAMTASGAEEPVLTFRLYDGAQIYEETRVLAGLESIKEVENPWMWSEELYPEEVTFDVTGVLGTVEAPLVINAGLVPQEAIPQRFALEQNFPNPFRSETTIRYALPRKAEVTLVIYDILGRKVVTLADGVEQKAGWHERIFDASRLASGVYFYRLKAGDFLEDKKMVLVK